MPDGPKLEPKPQTKQSARQLFVFLLLGFTFAAEIQWLAAVLNGWEDEVY